MQRITRRKFTQNAVGLAGATLGGWTASAWGEEEAADLVLTRGAIVTMDDSQPNAEAMAIKNGSILAVGKNDEIRKYAGKRTRVIDLAGKGVSPGIIDAHSHLISFGQMQLRFVILRPPKINSFATLNAELAHAAKEKPAGEWIVGRGFDTFKEGRFPRREEIDAAVPNHPVLIIHWGGQFGVANTLALQKAGLLRADVKDPYGGEYLRDRKTGVPDGVLIHYPAIYSVYQPEPTPPEQVENAEWAMREFSKVGVTCIHDNFTNPRHMPTYVRLEKMGRMSCRLRVYPYVKDLQTCRMVIQKARRYEGPQVRLQGIKLAVDGYALMYEANPKHKDLIIPMHPQPMFNAIIAEIHNAGYQVDVHAVGDMGVDWTLEAFFNVCGSDSECQKWRHRIEHFPMRKMDSIQRAARMGVPVCEQPLQLQIKADDMLEKLGPKSRAYVDTLDPLKTFMKEGVHVAIGADVPAFPSHIPLDGIRAAMQRKTQSGRQLDLSESVTFLEALRLYTLGSAYAAFDEKTLGSLSKGKQADFVIWNKDLNSIKTGADTTSLQVMATYLGGSPVYQV